MLFMFGAIAGGIASALAGGAMSKLFGGGQKAASGGIQGDVLATDNNTVGMGDAGIKSAIQGSNRSEERFSRNAETDLVCRLLLEKKNIGAEAEQFVDSVVGGEDLAFQVADDDWGGRV